MKPIAVFYHCLFQIENEPLTSAIDVVHEQMSTFKYSGLEDAAQEIHIGINGGTESEVYASGLLPSKARLKYHGLDSRSENLTLVMMEEWVKSHPGWAVLYFHTKGATHPMGMEVGGFIPEWRRRMMQFCVMNWPTCVQDLERWEACGCHWLMGQGTDFSQNYFAGNFFWVRSEFWSTIPSIYTRTRIKMSGIGSLESRYEAEVVIGNGPRLPKVRDYFPGHPFTAENYCAGPRNLKMW